MENTGHGDRKFGCVYYFLLVGGWVTNLHKAHLGHSTAVSADFLEGSSQRAGHPPRGPDAGREQNPAVTAPPPSPKGLRGRHST